MEVRLAVVATDDESQVEPEASDLGDNGDGFGLGRLKVGIGNGGVGSSR